MKTKFTIIKATHEDGTNYAAGHGEIAAGPWRRSLTEAFADADRFNADPAMLATLRNVRFWAWVPTTHRSGGIVEKGDLRNHRGGGWVRITLRYGQSLTIHRSGWNGEGYSSEAETWMHDGELITRLSSESGSDCDGSTSCSAEETCPQDRLAAVQTRRENPRTHIWEDSDIFRPDWQHIERRQRDYAAEAAGY